jgi:exodeoxyribonuclease VII large subunit
MAVPVLHELAATIDEFGLRQRKCALRPVQLGRERLEARVARLPRPEALAAQAAQKLDELGERLRRGLADRAALAERQLRADSARLSAPLLRARLERAQVRLDAVKLQPALLTRPIAQRRERLAALERLRKQLDPKAPLARGYALVCAPGHPLVTSRAVASQQDRLTLEFSDGAIEVSPTAGRPARAKPASAPRQSPGEQPKLL